jgi:hypothetical protein
LDKTPVSEDLEALARRLSTLERAGLAVWDAAGAQLVAGILTRAQESAEAVAGRLATRASAHLGQLEASFAAARLRAERMAEHLAACQTVEPALLEHLLERGGFGEIGRLSRRYPRAASPRRRHCSVGQITALEAEACARGITLPEHPESARADLLATALYRDSAASIRANLTLAKVAAAAPRDAGHYNAQHIAVQTLEALREHAPYLKAQLCRLELLAILPLPDAPKKRPAPRKRGR